MASLSNQSKRRWSRLLGSVAAAALFAGMAGNANAISVKEAIIIALEANPEIGEAIANREAREFELRQAHGLYLPQVDVEARVGAQRLDSVGTRAGTAREDGTIPSRGIDDDDTYFNRREANVVVQQLLFDGFNRRGERHHQAARVDSAGHRIYERSEAIALNIIREYLEYGLRLDVVRFSKENVAYHQRVLGDLKEGAAAEAISVADRQQAEERLFAAQARLIEATQDLNSAGIRFFKLVGKP
ncbi:MAG: TolC family protein, partial [Candidatus Tectomicrobia bacterium]|nr:TolC family protein [Candidatus Tectomicrobia bacterium]